MTDDFFAHLRIQREQKLDAAFEEYDGSVPNHIEVFVEDEDYTALSTEQRAAKRNRVRDHAMNALKGFPTQLRSASLGLRSYDYAREYSQGQRIRPQHASTKTALESWQNPWSKKRKAAGTRTQRAVVAAEAFHDEDGQSTILISQVGAKSTCKPNRGVRTQRATIAADLFDISHDKYYEEDTMAGLERAARAESYSTDGQSAAERQLFEEAKSSQVHPIPSPASEKDYDGVVPFSTGERTMSEATNLPGAVQSLGTPAASRTSRAGSATPLIPAHIGQMQAGAKRQEPGTSDFSISTKCEQAPTNTIVTTPSKEPPVSSGLSSPPATDTPSKRLCSSRINVSLNRTERACSVFSAGEDSVASAGLVEDWLKHKHTSTASRRQSQAREHTPSLPEADRTTLSAQKKTPSIGMPPPPTPGSKEAISAMTPPQKPANPVPAHVKQRRRISFNTTPALKSRSRDTSLIEPTPDANTTTPPLLDTIALAAPAPAKIVPPTTCHDDHNDHNDRDAAPLELSDFNTQAAFLAAQASFRAIMTPSQHPHPLRSPTRCSSRLNSPTSPTNNMYGIKPFRAFDTPPRDDDEMVSTQALFDAAKDFTFDTAKKPAPVLRERQSAITSTFKIGKASSFPVSSPAKTSPGKGARRPRSQDSEVGMGGDVGTMDIDKALEDVSGFLDVLDTPDHVLKPQRRTSNRATRSSLKGSLNGK